MFIALYMQQWKEVYLKLTTAWKLYGYCFIAVTHANTISAQ